MRIVFIFSPPLFSVVYNISHSTIFVNCFPPIFALLLLFSTLFTISYFYFCAFFTLFFLSLRSYHRPVFLFFIEFLPLFFIFLFCCIQPDASE
ncbi:hypothetical protein BRYFOR_09252 [Marvinbryantia formatexigens DSM 14469]|uniref:Uncharacterized protein n=1 Tax=Marvinbryantia formatexigens DSM 14469 TaxID=478749 RepID=C6LKQ4_9FIRM|nr:hypothetical protein BRYFOR_09252 [Marvinbryantia formatexigens DSM 14469]